ncbi:creatininase family protein [Draconibacterium halophilum]|uniref:creatininase family protein n=1 Tax=Draconibacterium halophilum TaxID=2706887 RepID=UPI0021CEB9BC|nr:creatininase family protein [Draconibacterium halophilum]
MYDQEDYFEEAGDHANEMETSIIMHFYPGLVRPLEEAGDGEARSFKLEGLKNKTAWAPANGIKFRPTPVLGIR